MMSRAVFQPWASEKKVAANNHLILLGVPHMKISSLGKLTLAVAATIALAAGSGMPATGAFTVKQSDRLRCLRRRLRLELS